MKQVQLFYFSSPADGTPTYRKDWFPATVYLHLRDRLVCVYIPTAVCRKLCDRAQGAERPLGAAVRQICRVAAEETATNLISYLDNEGRRQSANVGISTGPT